MSDATAAVGGPKRKHPFDAPRPAPKRSRTARHVDGNQANVDPNADLDKILNDPAIASVPAAAEEGNPDAVFILAIMSIKGKGAGKGVESASELLNKAQEGYKAAAAGGDAHAGKMLQTIGNILQKAGAAQSAQTQQQLAKLNLPPDLLNQLRSGGGGDFDFSNLSEAMSQPGAVMVSGAGGLPGMPGMPGGMNMQHLRIPPHLSGLMQPGVSGAVHSF